MNPGDEIRKGNKMSELDFSGKIIVVTGTSSGIGKSCAGQLLESGAAVIGIDVNDSDIGSPLYKHYMAGITDETAIEKIINGIGNGPGRIDGLVNAAGIGGSHT